MSQPSNHDRIEEDIEKEKSIIQKHQVRQQAILSQIETFKSTMQTQIVELQGKIKGTTDQINQSTEQMLQKKASHKEAVENLKSEIKILEQQHTTNENTKNQTDSKNSDDISKMRQSIEGKKTEIHEINNNFVDTLTKLEKMKTTFKIKTSELNVLKLEVENCQKSIISQSQKNEDMKSQDDTHNTQIMTDIESLTNITRDMKTEFETSQKIQSVLNEK